MSSVAFVESLVAIILIISMIVGALHLVRSVHVGRGVASFGVVLFPASQIFMVAALCLGIVSEGLSVSIFVLVVLLGAACNPVDQALSRAIVAAERRDMAQKKAETLAYAVEMEEAGVSELQAALADARHMRADISAELTLMEQALKTHRQSESEASVERIVTLAQPKRARYCAHVVLDALLALKVSEFEALGVTPQIRAEVPQDIPMASAELCAIVGNILDNALHACEKVSPDKRSFSLNIRREEAYLFIDAHNSAPPQSDSTHTPELLRAAALQKKTAGNASRVENRVRDGVIDYHGWGLSVIEQLAEEFDGAVSYEYEAGQFRISAMLHLAAGSKRLPTS